MEKKTTEYLKGYREGFEAAQKIIWAYSEQLLIDVPNTAKEQVATFIQKISS